MCFLWWAGAALAVILDAGRADAALFLSRCMSGSLSDAATRALDMRHVLAFPWTNAWMLAFCVLPHAGAGTSTPGTRMEAWARQLVVRLLAMAAAMPLACMAGWLATSALLFAWPPAPGAMAWGSAMLGACAALIHVTRYLPGAHVGAPNSPTSSEPARSASC